MYIYTTCIYISVYVNIQLQGKQNVSPNESQLLQLLAGLCFGKKSHGAFTTLKISQYSTSSTTPIKQIVMFLHLERVNSLVSPRINNIYVCLRKNYPGNSLYTHVCKLLSFRI